jgi:hypothetical protein
MTKAKPYGFALLFAMIMSQRRALAHEFDEYLSLAGVFPADFKEGNQ